MGQTNQLPKPTFIGITQDHQRFLSQLTDATNTLLGYNGTIPMVNTLDLNNNPIQNVAAPVAPTDALNLGTAEAKYAPSVTGPQLDVGGSNSLKGVTYLYTWKNKGLSVTITTAKLTGGGTNGSMTFTAGLLTAQVQAT
jgi:hypothetical protein